MCHHTLQMEGIQYVVESGSTAYETSLVSVDFTNTAELVSPVSVHTILPPYVMDESQPSP